MKYCELVGHGVKNSREDKRVVLYTQINKNIIKAVLEEQVTVISIL